MGKTLDEAILETERLVREYQAELAALIRARQRMSGGAPAPSSTSRPARPIIKRRGGRHRTNIKPTSSVGLTEKILREIGAPQHIDKILDQIQTRTGTRPKKPSLVGSLSQNVRDGKMFTREGPNTFGLIEWKREKRGGD